MPPAQGPFPFSSRSCPSSCTRSSEDSSIQQWAASTQLCKPCRGTVGCWQFLGTGAGLWLTASCTLAPSWGCKSFPDSGSCFLLLLPPPGMRIGCGSWRLAHFSWVLPKKGAVDVTRWLLSPWHLLQPQPLRSIAEQNSFQRTGLCPCSEWVSKTLLFLPSSSQSPFRSGVSFFSQKMSLAALACQLSFSWKVATPF